MKKALKVAQWEYFERIKNKSFLLMTFFFPLIVIGFSFLPMLIESKEDKETKVIGLIQKNVDLFLDLENSLKEYKTGNNQPVYILRLINPINDDYQLTIDSMSTLVLQKTLHGFIYLEKINPDSFAVTYHAENILSIRDLTRLEKKINQVITNSKLSELNIDPEIVNKLSKNYPLNTVKITSKGKEHFETEKAFLGGFFFSMILMISLITSGGLLVRSIVEEKSNRVIEILLSSCSAQDLMTGKIIGLSALGLTQIIVWLLVIISLAGPFALQYFKIENLVWSFVYFFLGYVLYTSIFVGIGSIGNTEQESQSIMNFVSLLLILPVMLTFQILENSNSIFIRILSYFPLTTTPMMTIRVNFFEISLTEKFVTILILIASIILSIKISSKIFRVAILSYGKFPHIKEVIGWLKSE